MAAGLLLSPMSWAQQVDISDMEPEQVLEEASARIDEMQTAYDDAVELRARTLEDDESDIVKIRCMNDRISVMGGFLRLMEDHLGQLAEKLAERDMESANHSYYLVVLASQRFQNLANEMSQCAGDILTFTGEQRRQFDIDPTIPQQTDLTASTAAMSDLAELAPEQLPESTPFQ